MLKVAAAAFIIIVVVAGSALAETPYERGRYLVNSILSCGNCHTPKGPKADKPGGGSH